MINTLKECRYEVVLIISKILKSSLKHKKMLFCVVQLSHFCEFEVEHQLPNQPFSRPLFDYHHAIPVAYLSRAKIT